MQRYMSLVEAHFKHVDEGRFTFFNAWFGDSLRAPRTHRPVGAEDTAPPLWLAASHDNPLNTWPPLQRKSVLFMPVFDNYRTTASGVNDTTRFGNGHYWAVAIFVETGIIAHWDSQCDDHAARLSPEHNAVMRDIACYMNERLRLRGLPPRKWLSRRGVHVAVQRDASCGVFTLKTIEFAARHAVEAGSEREWHSTFYRGRRRAQLCADNGRELLATHQGYSH